MGLKFSYDFRIAEGTAAGFVLRDAVETRGSGFLAWIALVLPPAAAALCGAYLVTAGGLSTLLAILIVGVSVWIGYLLFDLANRLAANRIESLKPKEGMGCDVELLEEGVRQASSDGDSLFRWQAFHSGLEDKGSVFLITAGSGVFIPARAFPSPETRREAIAWIYARLTPEARARSASLKPKPAG